MLAGKEDNIETVRNLMSYTFKHANTVGIPRGQVLDTTTTASTSRDIASGSPSSTSPRDQAWGSQVVALKVYLYLPGLSSLFGLWEFKLRTDFLDKVNSFPHYYTCLNG